MTHRLIVFLLSILPLVTSASIKFEHQGLAFNPKFSEKYVDAVFPFVIDGNDVIQISKVKTSCGCTAASLDKKVYNPGDSGEIKVKYETKGRNDKQTVTVSTVNGKEYKLIISVKIPAILEIKPKMLLWVVGEEAIVKDLSLNVTYKDEPVNVVSAESNSNVFHVELEKIDGAYVLHVRPQSTRKRSFGRIHIMTDFPKDKPKDYWVYARIDNRARVRQ